MFKNDIDDMQCHELTSNEFEMICMCTQGLSERFLRADLKLNLHFKGTRTQLHLSAKNAPKSPVFRSMLLHYGSNCIFFIATIAIKYLSQKNLLFVMNVLVIPTFEFFKCCIVKTASNISFRICFIQNQFVEKLE